MKRIDKIPVARALVLLLVVWGMSSCKKSGECDMQGNKIAAVRIGLSLDESSTKSFTNTNPFHHVDRVLILPFGKTAENLSNDDANFIPAYSLAKQIDVSQFPVTGAVIYLPEKVTHKVLVIGYNRNDYDFTNRTNPANRFDIGSLTSPTTLANFHLSPKAAIIVPEFFIAVAKVSSGTTVLGETFLPEQMQPNGYTLSGNLNRLVSGLSMSVSNIPSYVKSLTLVAENLTKISKATNAAVLLSQTPGDNENRVLDKKTPDSNGSVTFEKYLLPNSGAGTTRFFLDVELGTSVERYVVKVPDSGISSANQFTLYPNQAVNLTGGYSSINLGFTLGFNINLDDNFWDGWQTL